MIVINFRLFLPKKQKKKFVESKSLEKEVWWKGFGSTFFVKWNIFVLAVK